MSDTQNHQDICALSLGRTDSANWVDQEEFCQNHAQVAKLITEAKCLKYQSSTPNKRFISINYENDYLI